jgi:YVTN family beta-propeller protein
MTYSLGVDLGTTFVAAAVARPTRVEMFTLGDHTVVAPAVVYVREDGSILTGGAAERRAVSDPNLVGREVKRRLGDPTPIMLRSRPYPVTTLLAAQLRDVVQKVVTTEGEPPECIVLTHPANWGPFRRELFDEVSLDAGLEQPQMVTEPEAAAAYYATSGRLGDGEVVAVYDLGGGTFDATVVRKQAERLEILGTPEGIERLGGVDFDDAILSYVNYTAGGVLAELDMGDAATAVALARLRHDCVLAKEALSVDTEAVIPVFLPGRHLQVQLTRAAFEDMVRAPIESTIGALSRTVRSAGLAHSDLNSVLLVGGSSRIPLIAEMVEREFDRPTVADAHPKYAVALGAASISAASLPGLSGLRVGHAAGGPVVRVDGVGPAAPAAIGVAPAIRPKGGVANVPAPRSPAVDATVGTPERTPTSVNASGSAAPPAGGNGSSGGASWGALNGPTELRNLPRPALAPPSSPAGSPRSRTRVGGVSLAVVAIATVLLVGLVYVLTTWRTEEPTQPDSTPPPTASAAPFPTPTPTPPSASIAQPAVGGKFSVGTSPQAGAVTPDGKFAYVTNVGSKTVSVVDLATNAVVADIPIDAGPPVYVAFTPDGSRAYVSVHDEVRGAPNSVVLLDTQTRAVIATIPAEAYPFALAISPNGRQVYVPNHDANLITVIDTTTNAVVNKITVKPNPHSVAFSVDGRRAYVANHASNLVTVLDTKNGAVLAEIAVPRSPHSIVMSPDGSRVYVVCYDADVVAVIDPAAYTVTGTIQVQREPQSVQFAPDSKHAYVVNDGSNSVSVVDTETSKVTATVAVGQTPTDVFVAPDGKHAYVTNISSNDVTVLNTAA